LSRSQFITLVLAGALIRAAALAGPGTGDLTIWKVWTYNAARHGVGGMYGVGGTPPERRELEYAGATATVDYPPLALWELGVAGNAYWIWSHRRFPNARPLNAFVKLPGLAAEIGLTLLLFALVRARRTGFFRREALGVKARILLKLGLGNQLSQILEEIMSLEMKPGIPGVRRERDFVDRAPSGMIAEDVIARYNVFCPRRDDECKDP